MYIDSRPASIFKPTSGWSMPTPQPHGALKRPPVCNEGGSSSSSRPPLSPQSSSSSLSAHPQDVPSFQSFIQRTASIDSNQNRPLPPRPNAPKDLIGSLDDRRSSSEYSRTPSQPQTPRCASQDSEADSPLVVRPMAYSASSPDLTPPLLEPRTFSPLIDSPGTTTIASNSPPRSRSHSMLAVFPAVGLDSPTVTRLSISRIDTRVEPARPKFSPPLAHHGARNPVRTVSLEKAKEALHAPGVIRLLPEEFRAQALTKVKSHGHMRVDSVDMFSGAEKAPIPSATPVIIHQQGRETALPTPWQIPRAEDAFPSPSFPKTSAAYNSFAVGSGPVREMAPPLASSPSETKITWRQMSRENIHEPRGRTVERRSYEKKSKPGQKPFGKSEQSYNVREYHSLLTQQQYRQASESPDSSSDNSIRTHMKLVPQPLFQAKQPPRSIHSGSSRGSNSNSSVSPFNIHKRIRSDGSTSSTDRSPGFGLRLSLETSENKTRHSSTTGMIPISPPMDHHVQRCKPPHVSNAQWQPNPRTLKSHSRQNSRESSFYPHVFPRKNSNKKDINLGKPLLKTSVITQRLRTPDATPDTSPLQNNHERRPSSVGGSDGKAKSKFFVRFGGKSRRRFSVQSNVSSTHNVSPSSPHLLPSPVRTTVNTNTHLGRTNDVKATFEEARSTTTSTRHHHLHLTHIITPAKPLDGSRPALADEEEPESPTTPTSPKRGKIFGNVLEVWREGKAARRREDLKRLIKVLPPGDEGKERKSVGIERVLTESGDGDKRRGVEILRRNSAEGWM